MKATAHPLFENQSVRQRPEEGFRRWFMNSFFELIVWYDHRGGALYGFQLCISRNAAERAFTWTSEYSSSHFVSEGFPEAGTPRQATGILQGDGKLYSEEILERFEEDSQGIDEPIRSLVVSKIREYNARHQR